LKVALVGAESTGKTTLADALANALRTGGRRVAVVPEVLREWCDRERRAPRPEECLPIAREQERGVDAAAAGADIVIADTTALMVALYGAMLFEGEPLLDFAFERQRGYDVTLLTGLDLPWVDDGLQRAGPAERDAVDAQLRELLSRAGVGYRVVYGSGEERLRNALAALPAGTVDREAAAPATVGRRWVWQCDKCSDPDCEHRLFSLTAQTRSG
jgi:nicotinamide riboside kinase